MKFADPTCIGVTSNVAGDSATPHWAPVLLAGPRDSKFWSIHA